ncbi:hypothetical protein ACFSR6_00040 [Pedobacter vanadiisoli]|uniref:NVEALA protein n=1 Tax=Pedobacter vanadiisoli TaxID=1761975 RepID=A0ABW5MDT6_9SPHI
MKNKLLSIIGSTSVIIMLIFTISLNSEESNASRLSQNNLIALQKKVGEHKCGGPKMMYECQNTNDLQCSDEYGCSIISDIEDIK